MSPKHDADEVITTVTLNRTLAASQARISPEVKHILTSLLKEAIIAVYHEYFYKVDFGSSVNPEIHIVSHDLFCTCALEGDCPAVTAVKVYLQKEAGEEAKTPDPGYFPAAPHFCPVCGGKAYYHLQLSSHHRGSGWSCEKGGTSHYWQHQIAVLRSTFEKKWGNQSVVQSEA